MNVTHARILGLPLLAALLVSSSVARGDDAACNPRSWTLSTVDKNVLDADSYVTATWIFLDAAGSPSVVYSRGPEDGNAWKFRSAVEDSGVWRIRKVPTDQGTADLAVAVDSRGRQHLAWRSGVFFGQGILHYGLIDGGSWHDEVVDADPGDADDISIAVDADDHPHIVYSPELAGRPMRYARWDGTAWSFETVLAQGTGAFSVSLALDSEGEPHVAYPFLGGGEVDHAFRVGGVWTHEVIDAVAPNQSLGVSLAIDANDMLHVAYDELPDVGIHYATKQGSSWTTELVEAGQRWTPSLRIDAYGTPHMVFYHAENGALRYAVLSPTGWCAETIEDSRNELTRIGRNASLAIDGDGGIHVSYHYHAVAGPCRVRYAVSEPASR